MNSVNFDRGPGNRSLRIDQLFETLVAQQTTVDQTKGPDRYDFINLPPCFLDWLFSAQPLPSELRYSVDLCLFVYKGSKTTYNQLTSQHGRMAMLAFFYLTIALHKGQLKDWDRLLPVREIEY